MLVGVEFNRDKRAVVASHYNEAGEIAFIEKKLMPSEIFNWKVTNGKSEFLSWDDKPIAKNQDDHLSRYRCEEILTSKLSDHEKGLLSGMAKPKVFFLDIETEVNEKNDFPKPEEAKFPVNVISLVVDDIILVLSTMVNFMAEETKNMQDEVHAYLEQYKRPEQYKLSYKYFATEQAMLEYFFHRILPQIPFFTGWNVLDFDWQTLYNRGKYYGIDITANLPSKRMFGKLKTPIHTGVIDYMEICKQFRPVKMAENNKLDYMARMILGMSKVKHPYPSFYEFQKDSYMFIKYNIIDSVIVQLIDKAKNLLDIAFSMGVIANVEISKIFSPVSTTELYMCREFIKDNKFMPDIRQAANDEKYPGAYVMEPIPGIYFLVVLFDFASEYPNVQMQFNISPEMYLGKVGKVDLSGWDPSKLIVTKYGTVFRNDKDSAARKILSRFYKNRFDIKNPVDGEMQLMKKKLDEIKAYKSKRLEEKKIKA